MVERKKRKEKIIEREVEIRKNKTSYKREEKRERKSNLTHVLPNTRITLFEAIVIVVDL